LNYRVKVIALASKMSGFLFTSQATLGDITQFVIPEKHYAQILADFADLDPFFK